ncbi:phage major capsid protein [Bradyrhizobium sp. CB2312]|uniref:phage major capsid protein n=1 Tax=Bradyrhizobium sp. CB2312 TaxID=3039155 RepID=UPI0024B1720E|nr:phage major capsid protein [Bradyrhizobium sp. CB2312]WFU69447.1 phage major capsid protein [Bradyrhizobium sp. CB2312]
MKTAHALEFKDTGDADDPIADVAKQLADLRTTLETKAANDNRLTERLDRIEAKINRPGNKSAANDNEPQVETKALNSFLRGGLQSLDDVEKKTLNLGTTTAGGFVVAPDYSTRVIEGLTQFSPLRSLANVMSIGTTETYIPILTSGTDGGWVTETGPRPSAEPAFDQANIKTFEYAATLPVSVQLLEDSAVDLASLLQRWITKKFGKAEASAFVVGDGNGKPTGLLHTPADYTQIVADQDGSDFLEKLINLFYALPGEYANVGAWMMKRSTMGFIRQLADVSPLRRSMWSDSLANGTPATLLGRPIFEAPDMDGILSTASPGAETYPVVFGDYASAYQIVDRVGVAVMRDDFTGADNGIVKLRARRRVGGKPILPEAVVVLKATA